MKQTMILYPFDEKTPNSDIKTYKESWKSIKSYLDDLQNCEDMTFEDSLLKLNITEENYLLAIRSSLNAATIFLKQKPNEMHINNYNADCLTAWRANMDIQYVLDVYACAVYIANYISKSQKDMSELLRQACTEVREGNCNIKQQVRDIGSKFLIM